MWVRDQAANDKFYLRGALDRMGIKRDLDVVSSPDRTHPTLVSYRRTPSAVDVRTADQQVTVTVHAKDTGAGVKRVFADFFGGRFSHFKMLERVSGTPQDGLWRGTVRIRECPAATLTLSGSVWLSDARGNDEFVSPRVLRQSGWPSSLRVTARDDAMRPRVHARYHVPRVGPIVLTFNEAVNGLTDNSVTVRQINVFDSSPPGPVIPGELVCKKASGAVTSCTEGRVRSATFRPSEAFDQGRYFLVELNPEHSLEATDLAGNPFDRNGVIVTTDNTKTDSGRARLPRLEPPARASSPGVPAPLRR